MAAKKQIIHDPAVWFVFSEVRIEVANAYNEGAANKVYQVALKFLPETQLFFHNLDSNKG